MKIFIITSIYPPEIGGPAEYAKNLEEVWHNDGNRVSVKIFGRFKKFPWGIRHIIFFFYILPAVSSADCIFALDAFSTGVVLVASKLFSKKVVFRTGGDVLWELYVKRTGDMVTLPDFYKTRLDKLSAKENIIFGLMKWTLKNLSGVIWSTKWQRDIFMEPYGLQKQKHFIVENYYGLKVLPLPPQEKNFVASGRNHKLKNIEALKRVFEDSTVKQLGAILDIKAVPPSEFLEKIRNSYAVLVASLSEISPNPIISAISAGKPFIVTKENGLYERIKDVALFVDPKNPEDIKAKILWLCNPENYEIQKEKLSSWDFVHSWEDIAREYLEVQASIK